MTNCIPKSLIATTLILLPLSLSQNLRASDTGLVIESEGARVIVQFPLDGVSPQRPVVEKPVRVGIAEDLTDDEEVGDPEGKVSISLPDGTRLDFELPMARYDAETGEALDNTLALRLPDGTEISLQLAPSPSAVPEAPKPVRVGIAEDVGDEEEVGDPEGLVALLLPTGAFLTISPRPAAFRESKPTKPPRNGIAEDDTDVEEVGDPEGIIAILPGGGDVRVLTDQKD